MTRKEALDTYDDYFAVDEGNVEAFINSIYNDFESQHKWISVDDRLPEERDSKYDYRSIEVLAINKVGSQFICAYDFDEHRWKELIEMLEVDVTHWMPLPNPPKTE